MPVHSRRTASSCAASQISESWVTTASPCSLLLMFAFTVFLGGFQIGTFPIKWETLLRIRHIPFARLAFFSVPLVPVAATVLDQVEGAGVLVELGEVLPLLYFSSVMFTFGAIATELLIPAMIKQHGDIDRYRAFVNERAVALCTAVTLSRPRGAASVPTSPAIRGDSYLIRLAAAKVAMDEEEAFDEVEEELRHTVREVLTETRQNWEHANAESPFERAIICIVFSISLIGASWTTLIAAPMRVFEFVSKT